MEKIFKAKRLDTGEWFEFTLDQIGGSDHIGNLYVYDIDDQDDCQKLLDKDTICQYTGIDAKNGRIFEGDEVYVAGVGNVIVSVDVNGVHCGDEPYICCYGDIEHLTGKNIHDRG